MVHGERGCSGLRMVSRRDFLKSLGGLIAVSEKSESRGGSHKDPVTPVSHQEKEIPFVCTACERGCGVLLTVRGNEVVGFEGDPDHPANQGFLCEQGAFLFSLSVSENKCGWTPPLLYRPAGGAGWEAKDWGWVLRTIALRIKDTRGAEIEQDSGMVRSIGCLWDNALFTSEEAYLFLKFFQALGVPVQRKGRRPGALSFRDREDVAGGWIPGASEGSTCFWDTLMNFWYAKNVVQDLSFERLQPQDVALTGRMVSGNTKGLFIWGGGLLPHGPENQRFMLRSVEWVVLVDWFKSREDFAANCERITETCPKAEIFLLPAAAPWEKSGSLISAGRWVQWCTRVAEPQAQVRTPLWMIDRLFKALRDAYHGGGVSSGCVLEIGWDYAGKAIPDAELVAAEMHASFLEHGGILYEQAASSAEGSVAGDLQVETGYGGGKELSMRRSLDHGRWGFLLPQ